MSAPRVAIVDYGMGNLQSVRYACEAVGIDAVVTDSPAVARASDGLILPGVGAFGDAMEALRRTGLADAILATVAAQRPLLGICLGMQLLCSESHEFGTHEGLGVVPGTVRSIASDARAGAVRVPHVGWAPVEPAAVPWCDTPMAHLESGTYLYFVHSFFADVADPTCVASTTRYGGLDFVSSFRVGNVFGCQFHPERSGPEGLEMYRTMFTATLETTGATR